MKSYFANIKIVYQSVLDYLENVQNDDNELQTLNDVFNEYEIFKEKNNLKMILHLISVISENHKRSINFILKINIYF